MSNPVYTLSVSVKSVCVLLKLSSLIKNKNNNYQYLVKLQYVIDVRVNFADIII